MKNSHKFFENRECKFFPCHDGIDNLNCLFCYCPVYNNKDCPGSYAIIKTNSGKEIKDCSDCTYPHIPENYEKIVSFLGDKKNQI